jgi:hypothetical protein
MSARYKNRRSTMNMIVLGIDKYVGQIYRKGNMFYKVIDKYGPLVKVYRYHPHRVPQGRGYYG